MASDREKEREVELESTMYTNCLLLGLDPAVLGGGGGPTRVGQFRHSNPRLGEQLLYFLLSSLRGPAQSAKDFDKVWPIFDSTQSREFRKIVQGIISELESQGALPRSNSRVSSLATCTGPRFVELLWQLSVHALREVHKRTFPEDVASNPLPAPLTDFSYLNAASLLPVTKARIALERRKFLKNASIAVQRQTRWSNLANEMTAEYRSLCAEEAYLQQELEKLQDMRNKQKMERDYDDRVASSSGPNSHMISKATRLWESIISQKAEHEFLASGPIEDLIAHREHRYRISGPSLVAAMELGSQLPPSDSQSARAGEGPPSLEVQAHLLQHQAKEDTLPKSDERGIQPTVDVAEILRRWTHALQRIHRQSVQLAKANDGEGPDLLRSGSEGENGGHAESLAATLAEHHRHLASIQGLMNQLKESIPALQKTIAELTEEANSISINSMDELHLRSSFSTQAASIQEDADDAEATSEPPSARVDTASSVLLKLPPLFSLASTSIAKGTTNPRRSASSSQPNMDNLAEKKTVRPSEVKDRTTGEAQGMKESNGHDPHYIRRLVREVALSRPSKKQEWPQDKPSSSGAEHYFIPFSVDSSKNELTESIDDNDNVQTPFTARPFSSQISGYQGMAPANNLQTVVCKTSNSLPDGDDSLDLVFSPPLMMESSLFQDAYEDLLAPLSETDAALMEH